MDRVFALRTYSAKVSDVDLSRLQTCAESVGIGFPESAALYLAATGDTAGVKTENGQTVWDCYQELSH